MKIPILIKNKKKNENVDFGQNCPKITNLIKIFQNSRFWLKLTKMSILVEFEENVDFSQKFRKNVDLDIKIWKYLDIGQNFRKISILVKIVENYRFW